MFSFKMKWVTLGRLFGGPDTRRFPTVIREPFEGTRGNLVFEEGKCNLCTLCEKKCPTNALRVDRKAARGGWTAFSASCAASAWTVATKPP